MKNKQLNEQELRSLVKGAIVEAMRNMVIESNGMNFGKTIDGAYRFIQQHKDDEKSYDINDGSLTFGYGMIEANPYDFEDFLWATDRSDECARIGTNGEAVTIKDNKELTHYLNWCAETYDCLILEYK